MFVPEPASDAQETFAAHPWMHFFPVWFSMQRFGIWISLAVAPGLIGFRDKIREIKEELSSQSLTEQHEALGRKVLNAF